MNRSNFTRRSFLKGLGAGAGLAIGGRWPGASWLGEARAAAPANTTVVLVHLQGGYNALFASAGTLNGKFGIRDGNFTGLGGGVSIDNTFANSMSNYVKDHMSVVGVRHGISNHPGARTALWTQNKQNAGLVLANAIASAGPIKAALCGPNNITEAPKAAVNGTAFQQITDLQRTIDALGGGAANPRVPDRAISLEGIKGASGMSERLIAASPDSLDSLKNGFGAAVDTLGQPVKSFSLADLQSAYELGATTTVNNFKSQMAAAELMVAAGTSVISVSDRGWDSHGDTNGSSVRTQMRQQILPGLNTFLNRVVRDQATTRNVIVAIFGDFSRSLPGSDHQPNLSATVIGKFAKVASTGRVSATVGLPANTPSIQGFWSYLAALAKVDSNPFGANQHPTLMA